MGGGAGGDWGQRIGREYFMESLNMENIQILLHEIGHTYGLDDCKYQLGDPFPRSYVETFTNAFAV